MLRPRSTETTLALLCLLAAPLSASDPAAGVGGAAAEIQALADELLAEMRSESAYLRHLGGLPVTSLDDLTPAAAARQAAFARQGLARLEALPKPGLTHEQELMLRLLRHAFASGTFAAEAYGLTFAVTPYAGGWRFLQAQEILGAQPLSAAAERTNYLHLLDEYARLVREAKAKTLAQAERGVRLPRPAIDGAITLIEGLAQAAPAALTPAPDRLRGVAEEDAAAFSTAVAERITARIAPAFRELAAVFNADYRARASDAVGLGSLPGGKELYPKLIRSYTGLALTPEEIHQRGLSAVGDLEAKMEGLRRRIGFEGTREEFHQLLRTDPRFLAETPEEVEARYRRHVARIKPLLLRYFEREPMAGYDVKRLDLSAEPGMTYGYYQQPAPDRPMGSYRYNGSKLAERSLAGAAHLMYHELVPGHHFQIALQLENQRVHPVRAFLDHGAFVEGWAEYAASLAGEMGMYRDPYDLYGHLLMQAFLTSRLVVDTGMNAFGWSLERARQFMREHTFESETQIASESLRYSTDLYAQALCYRLGYDQIWEQRKKAEGELGPRFDLRAFHEAVIGSGSMPLDVLAWHIDGFVTEQKAR